MKSRLPLPAVQRYLFKYAFAGETRRIFGRPSQTSRSSGKSTLEQIIEMSTLYAGALKSPGITGLDRRPHEENHQLAVHRESAARYGSPASAGNAGGGIRRLEIDSYAEAALMLFFSIPGSVQNEMENGIPGAGSCVATGLVLPV
jgi:hypothetical protein